MTFYDISLFGTNIGGTNKGMWEVVEALKIVDKWYAINPDFVRDAPGCQECKLTNPYDGTNALWHDLLVRENVARDISNDANFKWTKKNGIGRKTASDFLDELVASQTETWFALEISEL